MDERSGPPRPIIHIAFVVVLVLAVLPTVLKWFGVG